MDPDRFLRDRFAKDEHALKKLESFSRLRHLPIRVMDRRGRELWGSRVFSKKGRFCKLLLRGNDYQSCRVACQKAARESIRWGVPIISNCCPSVLQITAPLMNANRLVGSLLASPFLMTHPRELDFSEFTSCFQNPPSTNKTLLRALASIPVLEEREVHEASEELFQLADEFSHPNLSCLAKVREIQDLQGSVAEEIRAVKAANPDLTPSKFFKLSYDTEREIIQEICKGEREKAKEILNKLLAIMLSQYLLDVDLLKVSILELVVVISRAAVEAGAKLEEILGLKFKSIAELWGVENQEELCLWVVKVVDDIIENLYRFKTLYLDQRVRRALEFIDQQFFSDLAVEQIAREAHLSTSRFSHLFKSQMGLTPIKYLTKVRIQNARQMLKNSKTSFADIAQELGYSDQSYFTKVFKKLEGLTPQSFRKGYLKPDMSSTGNKYKVYLSSPSSQVLDLKIPRTPNRWDETKASPPSMHEKKGKWS